MSKQSEQSSHKMSKDMPLLPESSGSISSTEPLPPAYELEDQIEVLRDNQRNFNRMLQSSSTVTAQVISAGAYTKLVGKAFAELAELSPALQNQLPALAETQRSLAENGETMLAEVRLFDSVLNTVAHEIIADALLTIEQYEAARAKYDAYCTELESSGDNPPELLLSNIESHRQKYAQLQEDAADKIKNLNNTLVEVMTKHMLRFANAMSACLSACKLALEVVEGRFNIHKPAPA